MATTGGIPTTLATPIYARLIMKQDSVQELTRYQKTTQIIFLLGIQVSIDHIDKYFKKSEFFKYYT